MKKIIIFLLFMFIFSILGGCSSGKQTRAQPVRSKPSNQISDNDIRKKILTEFRKWEGTPHKMGGNSKKGIDCSGFVYFMYGKLFNRKVHRSTQLLLTEGVKIKKSQLKPGDLVIFRPPTYPRHVGIYVGDNKFIHASTSKGVMMSDLNNPYWRKCYWMSRRVI